MNKPWCELLKDRHAGERAVLVCNGPSLSKMDMGFLKSETVIGLNKIYLGLRRFRFYPKYYVAINKKVLQQSEDEIKKLTCIKFLSNHCDDLYDDDALTHIIDTHHPRSYFCSDITEGVHEGWTVTFAALQIAYYLGFGEVVIIGMDHRYEYTGQPNESQLLAGPDLNHFCETYFGHGQTWDNPDLTRSEKSYREADEAYRRDGRRIIDATLDGACEVFTKADYRSVFNLD